METVIDRLAAAVEEALGEGLTSYSDAALLDRFTALHRIARKVGALTVEAAGAINQRGAADHDGATSTVAWIKGSCHESHAFAADIMQAAKLGADHPAYGEAMQAGTWSMAQVKIACRLAKKVGSQHASAALDALLSHAVGMSPADTRQVALRLQELLCSEQDEKPKPRDKTERNLFVSATFEGKGVIQGDLTAETTAKFLTIHNALNGIPDAEDDRVPAERRHDTLDEVLDFGLSHMDLPMVAGERPHIGAIVHASDLQTPVPGGKARPKARRFDGDDSLAALYAYLDDNVPLIMPDWVDDPQGWAADASLDWDLMLAVWADDADYENAPRSSGAARTSAESAPQPTPVVGFVPPEDFGAIPDAPLPHFTPVHTGPQTLSERLNSAYGNGYHRSRLPVPGAGGVTDWGGHLPLDALRRMSCDAGIHRVVFAPGDVPLSAGRQVRLVRASQHRIMVARDGGCRFPGCDRPAAWTQAHHVIHWADGGPTDVDNMVLLCGHHHRRVHEDGWGLEFDGCTLIVYRPDGTVLDYDRHVSTERRSGGPP
ncbi:DUF222 domain-containing protein [Cryptosporangium sp. NPDC048952]|uniref:HNH endonuclease signature motif containing protein n=1 Tax=Cryptosporangium sp. NPDC048952 TaxID=3363961 RepID=UPI0037120CAA